MYFHTNATSSPCWRTTNCARQSLATYIVSTSCRANIVLRSQSPRKFTPCLNVPNYYKGMQVPESAVGVIFPCQRRRNDDKNNFWEVESKGGVGRGFEKRVDRGPILKFYCRAKAQEKQYFGKSQFYCRRFFPGNTVTIILDNYPPSTLQGVGIGGRKNSRIIVGENYCHFGASYLG